MRIAVVVLDVHFLPFGKFGCELERKAGKPSLDPAYKNFKGQDKLLEGKPVRMWILRKSVDVKIWCKRTDALMSVNQFLILRRMELQEYKALLLNQTLSYSEA